MPEMLHYGDPHHPRYDCKAPRCYPASKEVHEKGFLLSVVSISAMMVLDGHSATFHFSRSVTVSTESPQLTQHCIASTDAIQQTDIFTPHSFHFQNFACQKSGDLESYLIQGLSSHCTKTGQGGGKNACCYASTLYF